MPELEDRRISAAYETNDRPESRSGRARLLEALIAASLVVVAVRVGYPLWFVGALTALGTFALAVERWVLFRRAFWVVIAASYLTLVSYIIFPYPWLLRWACCFVMAAVATSLFYWTVEK